MTETQKQWTERLSAWRASGLPAREFAEAQGLRTSTLRWWAKELRLPGPKASRGRPEKPTSAPMVLARVLRPGDSTAASPTASVVVHVGDARVIVQSEADEGLLRVVFRALGVAR